MLNKENVVNLTVRILFSIIHIEISPFLSRKIMGFRRPNYGPFNYKPSRLQYLVYSRFTKCYFLLKL